MPNEVTLEDLPALRAKHVYIKDEAAVLKMINIIIQGGASNLQIVTDFDLTLTKQHVNGKQMLSSFGIFGKCKQLPKAYAEESRKLYQKYRPIEIDPVISLEKKIAAMEDWMFAAQEILRNIEFDPQELTEVVRIYGTVLRDGTKELFQKLHAANVPVLVFSAGLGDVVEAILRHNSVMYDTVKVISNFLKYKGNKLDGFKNKRLIHVFNKNEYALDQEYFKIVEGRKNVLLMGDTTGDASMVDGMPDTKAVLKIGFLYDNAERSLDLYMEHYDIVLLDDQTMQVPSEILRTIF